jgi:hypothetical protein
MRHQASLNLNYLTSSNYINRCLIIQYLIKIHLNFYKTTCALVRANSTQASLPDAKPR